MLFRLYPAFSWRVWVFAVYWLSMAVGTHIPKPELPEGLLPTRFDISLHLAAFFGLTLLAYWALSPKSMPGIRAAGWWVAIVGVYAALDEFTQLFVRGRQADPWDWAADMAGVVLAMCLVAAVANFGVRRSPLAEGRL